MKTKSMQDIKYFTLNNGVKMPCVGSGSGWSITQKRINFPNKTIVGRLINRVINVLYRKYLIAKFRNDLVNRFKMGYRMIDSSAAYGNESIIAEAIKRSGLKREDVFITNRVSNRQQYEGTVRKDFMQSLKNFGVDYFDLYMFHWPVTDHFIDTYKELEKLYKEGLVKAIGVCNCNIHHLQEILDKCEIVPAVNQFEVHPLFTQKNLILFCKEHGIQVEAYTPLARNDDRLQKNLILKELGKKYNKSMAQIILRWDYQQGLVTIPRSSNPIRQASNIDIFDFELTDDEMKAIDSININSRLRFDPDNCDFSIL